MTEIYGGKMAFPIHNTGHGAPFDEGMTMRDYFAAKAMPICYKYWMIDFYHPDYTDAEDRNSEGRSCFDRPTKQLIAEDAYALADAMLQARNLGEQ